MQGTDADFLIRTHLTKLLDEVRDHTIYLNSDRGKV